MILPPELPYCKYHRQLGRGGTAEVSLVHCSELGRLAALKQPLDTLEESIDFCHLINREQLLIGGLTLPTIVRLYQVNTEAPGWLMMEHCPGPTLEDVGRVNDIAAAVNIISAMAISLEYLRLAGIIHGDLKPGNIFLPSSWKQDSQQGLFYSRISDFSLGRLDSEPQDARAGLGTVGYMAPEMITDNQTSFRSDLFALGVIAYQILTGKHPFMEEDADPVRVSSRVRELTPVPPSQLRPEVSEAVDSLVLSLLEKDKSRRPASGWEVCLAAERAGASYPFKRALRPGPLVRLGRSYQQNVEESLKVNNSTQGRLDLLTGKDSKHLRLLLTANFIRGDIAYDGNRFVIQTGVYWPGRLRREALAEFEEAPYPQKRQLIVAAVIGSSSLAQEMGILDDYPLTPRTDRALALLLHLLKPSTVKRVAKQWALLVERKGYHDAAAQLYLMAGVLDAAERCAQSAAADYCREHDTRSALRVLSRVIEMAGFRRQLFEVRPLLNTAGNIRKDSGEIDAAMDLFQELVTLYDNRSPDGLLAKTHKDIGDLFKARQQFEQGINALEKARRIFQDLGDELELSRTLNNMGNMYWVASDLNQALDFYRKALRMQRTLGAQPEIASTLTNVGSIFVINGRFDRALKIFRLSLRLKKEIGDAGEIARTLNNLGYTLQLMGDHTGAVDVLTESLQLNRRIDSRRELLFNLENLTAVMISAGQLRQSFEYLKEGSDLANELGDRPHQALFGVKTAIVMRRMGRFEDAARQLNQVENAMGKINDKRLEIMLATNRGWLRWSLGDIAGAVDFANKSLALAQEIDEKSEELYSLMLLARVSDDPTYSRRARDLASDLHLRREQMILDFYAGAKIADAGNTDEAAQLLPAIINQFENHGNDIEEASLSSIAARMQILIGNHSEAEEMTEKAKRTARRTGLLPELMTALILEGQIHSAANDLEGSYGAYRQALETAKQLVSGIESDDDRLVYQKRAEMQFLTTEIKKLAGRMKTTTGRPT